MFQGIVAAVIVIGAIVFLVKKYLPKKPKSHKIEFRRKDNV